MTHFLGKALFEILLVTLYYFVLYRGECIPIPPTQLPHHSSIPDPQGFSSFFSSPFYISEWRYHELVRSPHYLTRVKLESPLIDITSLTSSFLDISLYCISTSIILDLFGSQFLLSPLLNYVDMYWTQGNHLPTGCIPNEAVHCCVCTHCTERLSTVVYVQWGCPLLCMYSEVFLCCVCTVRLSTVVNSEAVHCCVQFWNCVYCAAPWICGRMARELFFNYCVPHQHHEKGMV